MGNKVALDLDKNNWHPSVLPGQIVLVSTVDAAGEPNVAPKSWVSMAAQAGPVMAFGCNTEHTTYRNLAATGEYVINIPGEPLAKRVWSLARFHGSERLRRSGLTLSAARVVKPSIIEECCAHLECRLDSVKQYGKEVFVFGRVVAASIDAGCQTGTPPEQYFLLRPIFFLEKGIYGTVDGAKWVDAERLTQHSLFVVQVGDPPGGRDENVVREHLAFLRELSSKGRLLLGGPFVGGPGGMYISSASLLEEAEEAARRDPLVQAGAPYTVRAWTRTF